MELVFVRHGQPAWIIDGLIQSDPTLTPLGWEQAARVGRRLATDSVEVAEILVSPALRAHQTAAPLATATGIAPETIDDIIEIQMPDWAGKLREEVQRIFAHSRSRAPDKWWTGLEGGESFHDFHDRVTAAMQRILAERSVMPDRSGHRHLWHVETDPRRIIVFGHGGTNAVAFGWLLGVEPTPWEWERFILAHASITRVRTIPLAGEHVFSLRAFNDQEHLDAAMRTR